MDRDIVINRGDLHVIVHFDALPVHLPFIGFDLQGSDLAHHVVQRALDLIQFHQLILPLDRHVQFAMLDALHGRGAPE